MYKEEFERLLSSSDVATESDRIDKLDADELIELLNRPIDKPFSERYELALRIQVPKWREAAFGTAHWEWLHEYLCLGCFLEPHIRPTAQQWLDASRHFLAFQRLAFSVDGQKALTWLRASVHTPPTIMETIYASIMWRESNPLQEHIGSYRKPEWSPLLREDNPLLFSLALGRAPDFASEEELLAAFAKATATEWPELHRIAIEDIARRHPEGSTAALKKYIEELKHKRLSAAKKKELLEQAERAMAAIPAQK